MGALTQDSRTVEKGAVFVAVDGFEVDGHQFIDQAIERGASVIICEDIPEDIEGVAVVQVDDTRSLLGPLAQAFEENPADKLTVIGVTGTNGKTTVATLIYQVLQQLGVQVSLLGTVEKRINNEPLDSKLTTADPIELARDMRKMVLAGSTHVVMEVSSHALQQQRVAGITFDVAGFTNLSHDHLDYHNNMDEYASAKKILFDALPASSKAIVNADDDYADFMVADSDAQIINFSFEESIQGGAAGSIVSSSADELTVQVEDNRITSPLVGRFNAYNLAQSFLICSVLGQESEDILEALKTAKGAPGRMEKVQAKSIDNQPVVLVDYAHTPAALENVLKVLAQFKGDDQTLHVIFGCGGDRDKSKRPRMAAVAQQYADIVTVTSDNPRTEDPDVIIDDAMKGFSNEDEIIRTTDRRKAIEEAIKQADGSTIILIAGKGHETYQEVNGTRHHFDDREIAREALDHPNGNPKNKEVA